MNRLMHENDSFFFINDKFGPFNENPIFEDYLLDLNQKGKLTDLA